MYKTFLQVSSLRYSGLALSEVSPSPLSHDTVSRWLKSRSLRPKDLWRLVEPSIDKKSPCVLGAVVTRCKGKWGGVAKDNRLFINAVFWILRTGSPWRDLPPDYGCWKNTHRRVCRWKNKGVWASILENLTCEADMEWLMIDATHIKVHLHGTGAVGGNDEMGLTKGGSTARYTWP